MIFITFTYDDQYNVSMNTSLTKQQLKVLVKESVREVLSSEAAKFRALGIPYVSEREQKEVERLYGKPSRRAAKSSALPV